MKREFSIPFVGLKNGINNFEYEIDGTFFEEYDNSLVKECNVSVELVFEKSTSLFVLEFKIDGDVELECDRCSENYLQSIFGDYVVIVKFEENESDDEDEDDVIFISRDATHLDVKKLIYDYINLSIPMKRTHPNDEKGNSTCNPVVLEILKKSETKESIEEQDPRWDALRKIKNKK